MIIFKFNYIVLVTILISIWSCKKYLPDERDSISTDAIFSQTTYSPVLGRYTLMSDNFYPGASTIPLTFKIVNPRLYNDGTQATIFNDTFPVNVWESLYSGTEASLDEIEAKRKIEYHSFFEIREHSGEFIMWPCAKSPYVLSQPDSGYVYDVEVSNSGGRLYYRNFRLMPYKERAFEPSNLNSLTGQATSAYINPSSVSNIIGITSGNPIGANAVSVFFHQINTTGHTLTFKFVDTLFAPINPQKFIDTDWGHLVHGFNRQMTDSSVTYDVAYPIPLSPLKTIYTNSDGTRANVSFSYHRQAFGNVRQDANINLSFSIYEEGDWEIVFWFRTDNPKFEDD